MTIEFVGALHDKRLRCRYCAFERDVPDSYSQTEETRSADGRHYVRKTVTRSDGASPLPDSFLRGFGLDPGQHGAAGFTLRTTEEVRSSVRVTGADDKLTPEALAAVQKLLQSQGLAEARPDALAHDTSGPHAQQAAARATSIYLWASAAVALVALLAFGSKGLFVAVTGLGLAWGWRAWKDHG
jgi:hypothetical protein